MYLQDFKLTLSFFIVYGEKRSSSPSTKICLKWNTYHNNIQTIFPTLLMNEQFVDVTLACEGQFMKCHKVSEDYLKLYLVINKVKLNHGCVGRLERPARS